VLVVHERWGLNDAIRKRVNRLASMGYVAFALDLYGKEKTTSDLKQATKWLRMVQMNVYRWHQRALAGLEVPQVDPQRIAAVGYGWGDTSAAGLQGSRSRGRRAVRIVQTADRRTVVGIKARILVLHGAADPYVDTDSLKNYVAAMEITRNGKPARFIELKPNDSIQVKYDATNRKVIAIHAGGS
jgi:dienelactone hydrolase